MGAEDDDHEALREPRGADSPARKELTMAAARERAPHGPMERMQRVLLGTALVLGCGTNEPAETPSPPTAPQAPAEVEARAEAPSTPEPAAPPQAAAEPGPPVNLIGRVATTVRVSSATGRDPAATIRRLFDGELSTAWSTQTGDLEGAYVEIEVPEGAEVTGVSLTAGYVKEQRGRDLFTANQRVRSVRVLRNAEEVALFELDVDSRALQTFPLEGQGGAWRFQVLALEDGSQEGWDDVSLSELQLLGRPGSAPTDEATTVTVAHRPFAAIIEAREADYLEDPPADRGFEPLESFFAPLGDEPFTRSIPFEPEACFTVVGQVRPSAPMSATALRQALQITLRIRGNAIPAEAVDSFPGSFIFNGVCLETGRIGELAIEGPPGTVAASVVAQVRAEEPYYEGPAWSAGDELGEPGTDPDAGPLLASAGGLELTDLVVAGYVDASEVNERRLFFAHPLHDRIYCQASLRNETGAPTEVHIAYEKVDGEPSDNLGPSYRVPGRERYKTFSYRGTRQTPGRYRCVVRTADGELLGQQAYDILPHLD